MGKDFFSSFFRRRGGGGKLIGVRFYGDCLAVDWRCCWVSRIIMWVSRRQLCFAFFYLRFVNRIAGSDKKELFSE